MLRDPGAPRSGEFFAPLPLAALVVLVLNDVYWKRQFHNFWTGKLSDVAVCFVMPLFISELLGLGFGLLPRVRLGGGALLTAMLFSALEVWPWLSQRAVALLDRLGPHLGLGRGFQMTSDWTDLGCVPLVWLSYQYGARRLSRTHRERSRSAPGLA